MLHEVFGLSRSDILGGLVKIDKAVKTVIARNLPLHFARLLLDTQIRCFTIKGYTSGRSFRGLQAGNLRKAGSG